MDISVDSCKALVSTEYRNIKLCVSYRITRTLNKQKSLSNKTGLPSLEPHQWTESYFQNAIDVVHMFIKQFYFESKKKKYIGNQKKYTQPIL